MEVIAHFSTLVLFMPRRLPSFAGRSAEVELLSGLDLSVKAMGKDV